jgi:hypothetical protein
MKQVASQADDANLAVTVLTALREGAKMMAAATRSNISISPTIWLGLLLVLASCEAQRPSFLTRVHEDCVNGDPWACGLLTSLAQARTERSADVSTIGSGE